MEFNEKLQELRKQKGLTQDQLAKRLFVSRTAISKWESGRGYPNLESLKDIAKFFSVTVDELLSSDEFFTLAQAENARRQNRARDYIFGVLDVATALLLFLPFFAQRVNDRIYEVSLFALTQITPYLKITYFAVIISLFCLGIATFALQKRTGIWLRIKYKLSLSVSALGIAVFVAGLQPYPSMFLFVFSVFKAVILIKWQ